MRLSKKGTDDGFHRLLEATPDATVIVDSNGRIFLVNVQAEKMFGYDREEMVGRPVEMLLPDQIRNKHQALREAYLASPCPRPMGASHDLCGQRKDGSQFPVEISLSPLTLEEGVYIISSLRDITRHKRYEHELEMQMQQTREYTEELERANAQLAALATEDSLTGIKNIRGFWQSLEQEYHRAFRSTLPFSLIMMDVDHFKQFNDTYGHPTGDTVLRAVAGIMKQVIRFGDVIARYGGEEFVLLLPNTGAYEAWVAAERLRNAISNHPWPHAGVTVSMGISTLTLMHITPSELIEEADEALYFSKSNGRNQATHYSDISPSLTLVRKTERHEKCIVSQI